MTDDARAEGALELDEADRVAIEAVTAHRRGRLATFMNSHGIITIRMDASSDAP